MSKLLSSIALAAMLTACSAAAENTTSITQMTAEPALLDASTPVASAHVAPQTTRAPPSPHIEASHEAVTCEVNSRRTANGVTIQARAFADRNIDGEYDLQIIKSGGGNSSEINQNGPISLRAGQAATLGENEISMERGARVRAVLTLRDDAGQICRRTFRL